MSGLRAPEPAPAPGNAPDGLPRPGCEQAPPPRTAPADGQPGLLPKRPEPARLTRRARRLFAGSALQQLSRHAPRHGERHGQRHGQRHSETPICRPFPSCPRHRQRHRARHTPRHRARHTNLNKNKKKKFSGVPRCRLAPRAHSAHTAHTRATLGGLPAPGLRPSRATPSNPDRTIQLESIQDPALQPCRCKNVQFVAKKWRKVWRFREKALSLRHGSR